MTDIVERLRERRLMITGKNGKICDTPDDDCIEAAAEIERLRAKLAEFEEKWRETQRMLR